MKISKIKMTSHAEHLDKKYGKRGTTSREKYEAEFEIFMLGAKIQEMRLEKGMTQTELAEKCGTTKTYISRIENNSSSSLKGCRGAMAFRPASYGISYACCQNVLTVGRGLRFRRCGSMGVVSGVGCLLEG